MKVGDRVIFTRSGKYFDRLCDNGTILARIEDGKFDRPWLVKWDTGLESRPRGDCLRLSGKEVCNGD